MKNLIQLLLIVIVGQPVKDGVFVPLRTSEVINLIKIFEIIASI